MTNFIKAWRWRRKVHREAMKYAYGNVARMLQIIAGNPEKHVEMNVAEANKMLLRVAELIKVHAGIE